MFLKEADQMSLKEAYQMSLKEADQMSSKKPSNLAGSTFRRKRQVAELMIVDPTSYKDLIDRLARSSAGRRISQEFKKLLKKPALQRKLRVTVTDGHCI